MAAEAVERQGSGGVLAAEAVERQFRGHWEHTDGANGSLRQFFARFKPGRRPSYRHVIDGRHCHVVIVVSIQTHRQKGTVPRGAGTSLRNCLHTHKTFTKRQVDRKWTCLSITVSHTAAFTEEVPALLEECSVCAVRGRCGADRPEGRHELCIVAVVEHRRHAPCGHRRPPPKAAQHGRARPAANRW